uniref:Uncharacterized protein n=1 Tax=Arundo donax TaxID=35708 RepID=A0A0A8ZS01_ARUDO
MLGLLPSSATAPSYWYAEVAAPKTKSSGKSLLVKPRTGAAPCVAARSSRRETAAAMSTTPAARLAARQEGEEREYSRMPGDFAALSRPSDKSPKSRPAHLSACALVRYFRCG